METIYELYLIAKKVMICRISNIGATSEAEIWIRNQQQVHKKMSKVVDDRITLIISNIYTQSYLTPWNLYSY